MSIRLLLCDLDGTLVDSLRDIVTSCNLLLTSYGAPALDESTIRPCIGRGVAYLVHGILRAADCPVTDIDAAIARYREIYHAHALDETQLYPGVYDTLALLRKNVPDLRLAVVSNKPERASREVLEAMQIEKYFSMIAGGDTFAEMKPSPLPLQSIMQMMGAAAEETAMVGDSVYDLQAGKAAGVRTIAALYGFQPAEKLKALEPDFSVSAFDEILNIVAETNDVS
ncbi:MAG: HAD-IA family hydrolase [Bacteroidetes bacterium]|nr:HAD-IA family hydrolase [Bacteroidota bacterium]